MLLSVKVVTTTPPRGISSPGNSVLRYINCIISPATIGKAHWFEITKAEDVFQ